MNKKLSIESQNIEYKESWRDEYLKWICGFANAQGGTIYIGIDDSGEVVGVKNIRRLLDEIPNKIQTTLGIVADVNKHTKKGIDYLEIKVRPSSFPISYHGEFHYRSGSTKQQLTGIALSEFIMHKTGFRWEDVTVDNLTVDDLDDESFKIFRREALKRKRMTEEELNVSNEELLQKLHLMTDGKLKRSAVLLFYHDPQIIQNGIYIKVGKFENGEVIYHHDLEESLIVNASKVVDLIFLMYLKAKITYERDRRVETYPYAFGAIREAIFNAIAHSCYMSGVPIQIRIEEEAIIISNICVLPENWTVDTFMETHVSKPYNPDIANVLYRAGFIEKWGQGIQKICDECRELGTDPPVFELLGTSLRVHFKALKSALIEEDNNNSSEKFGKVRKSSEKFGKVKINDTQRIILELISADSKIIVESMAEKLNLSTRAIEKNIRYLREVGVLIRRGGRKEGHWEVL